MTKVSVIIPCYNQGAFLPEAVESVKRQTCKDLEIVIVNDGSDDELTIQTCNSYDDPLIKVINTDNQGLASARNNGIREAQGRYILPLDADDSIAPEYIEEAVKILETNRDAGIVYCRAKLFGAVEGDWTLPEYSLDEMLMDNIIFCTALFHKSDWEDVGGYDSGMIYGWEDYDFWLSLIENGRSVHCIDKPYFFYRVAAESMVRSRDKEQKIEMFKRIFQRHRELFANHIEIWLRHLVDFREQYLTSRLYVDCGDGVCDAESITRKVGKGLFVFTFPIDSFENRQALRFDPVALPVCVELQSVELSSDESKFSIDLRCVNSNAAVRNNDYFMFASDDPQLFLTADRKLLQRINDVKITCTYTSFGDEALREIIDFTGGDAERKKNWNILAKLFSSRNRSAE